MRTCEENLALRAWASARHRQRPAAQQLRELLPYPTPRRVYARQGELALSSGCPKQIAAALLLLQQEGERCRQARTQVLQAAPNLYRQAA